MRLQPRSYQIECVNALYAYFSARSGNPVCALPTGTGKSVVIAMFLESIFMQYPMQKVMVLTHVKELIEQNYSELLELWPSAPAGVNSAGLNKRDTYHKIIFGGIATVAKRWADFGRVDLVIIDEAHLVSPHDGTLYQLFLRGLRTANPYLKVIGFTATPWRLGHGRITEGGLFDDIAFDITGLAAFNRLIAEGYLAPLVPKQPKALLDVSGVHVRGGEFIAGELAMAVDKDDITERALKETIDHGADRAHWLIFCAGVDHAIHVSDMLNTLGVSCAAVHSNLSSGERARILQQYKAGQLRAVTNNNVLTTGFNFPGIDLIAVLRPTASPVLWVQMLGRGTRPAPGKQNCLVLDFSGNTKRLGPINDPVIPARKGTKGGDAPIKLCEACDTWNHASLRYCVSCGAEFPPPATKLKQTASTDELVRGDMPVTEVFAVDHITYSVHNKVGRPPAMKLSYYCGLRVFNEYVCIEHEGFARRKAQQWWKARSRDPMPATTKEALECTDSLPAATHLRVWTNKPYPEILAHCFDGSAFGREEDPLRPPTTVTYHEEKVEAGARPYPDDADDDIPF